MKKKSTFILLATFLFIGIIFAGGYYYFTYFHQSEPIVHVHTHAGFHVYVDGVKQDFSGFEHMSFTPCGTDHSQKLTPAELQLEKTHLHDGVGEVAHVHHQGATWGDLLKNINFEYDQAKELAGYTETGKVENILSQEIKDNDSIIIVIGDQAQAAEYFNNRVTPERITQVAQSSELCGGEE
ncbi:MAG TPA: hypothetical protein VF209_00040 [Patescibacteria group bacterium]